MVILIGKVILAARNRETTYDGLNGTKIITSSVDNFEINGQREAQIAAFFRGDQVIPYDRGNEQTTITFSSTREHTTVRASEVFIVRHYRNTPKSGLITVRCFDDGGAITELWLETGIVNMRGRYIGVTSIFNYQILGGKILTKAPAST